MPASWEKAGGGKTRETRNARNTKKTWNGRLIVD
jgi:hypothetical protein